MTFNIERMIDDAVIEYISATNYLMDGKQHRAADIELRQLVEEAIESTINAWKEQKLSETDKGLCATYFFDMPVIVEYYPLDRDEENEPLPTRKEVIQRVVDDFNSDDMEMYLRSDNRYRDVKIRSFLATPGKDCVRVKARTFRPHSAEDAEKIRLFLSGQCSDGWGENGWELNGFNYGYQHRRILVHVWSREKDVTLSAMRSRND